jgi:hypothetical protein
MRNRVYAGAALVVAIVFGYAFSRAFQTKAQGIRQPFTMIVLSQGSLPAPEAGQEVRGIRRLLAVRSDGSSVTVSLPPEGDLKSLPQFGDRAVYLRPQQQYVYLLDKLKLKTTSPLKSSSLVPPTNPTCLPVDGGRSRLVGTDTVLGWPAYVYELNHTAENGSKEITTRWLAPALNCREIQGRLEIRSESRPDKTLWNRAVSLTVSEPDPTLFAVPDDYREVSPGEMERERAKSLGRAALPATLEEHLKSKDEAYSRARSK